MSGPDAGEDRSDQPAPVETTAAVVQVANREKADSLADTARADWQQDIDLKRRYANAALIGCAVQVGLADLGFAIYATALGWKLPTAAISAWLAATVVQVVAITLAVTRGLFPGGRR